MLAIQPIQAHSPHTHRTYRHSRDSLALLDLFSSGKRPCAACWLAQIYQAQRTVVFIQSTLHSLGFTCGFLLMLQAMMPVCYVTIRLCYAKLKRLQNWPHLRLCSLPFFDGDQRHHQARHLCVLHTGSHHQHTQPAGTLHFFSLGA